MRGAINRTASIPFDITIALGGYMDSFGDKEVGDKEGEKMRGTVPN